MEELVFMRHGHALGTREAGVCCDSERPLSPRGEEEVLESARHLKAAGFSPGLIISSPFLRAAREEASLLEVYDPAEKGLPR